ncbi:MAG: histone deacetylase [Dehalococcoidia bacterium]|nr:histone deacetylase [Dehalococcoidia bacterium]
MRVGLVYDPIYLEHDTGQHVENATRLVKVMGHLEETKVMGQIALIRPRAASLEELSRVHSMGFISYVESFANGGGGWLDADTVVSPASYEAARYAVGGLIKAVDAVMAGNVESAFALVRPPGHHALRWKAMGFCLFNNIAIAAKHAISSYQLDRILIVDFDVHHGNGTQDTFYDDPHVLYYSTHQYPFYPGSGRIDEIGAGLGEGFTVNVPLPAWCGDEEYLRVFEEVLVPVARRFRPQLILVSAGYDPHWADQISLIQLSVTGFAQMVGIIKGLADELCSGKLAITLEGGYHLEALASSVRATFDVLLGNPEVVDPLGRSPGLREPPRIDALLQAIKDIHKLV